MEQRPQRRRDLGIRDLGCIDFEEAWARQRECVDRVLQGGPETLLICEHPAVITMGRSSRKEHILAGREDIEARGIRVIDVDRGGDVTLHCPGQLIAYPILDLRNERRDLKFYLHQLEQVAIDFFGDFGILACRIPSYTGAWIQGLGFPSPPLDSDAPAGAGGSMLPSMKIASIGIGVRKWISYHGISINIDPDLRLFSLIRPCGLDVRITSLAEVTGGSPDARRVREVFAEVFARHFCGSSLIT